MPRKATTMALSLTEEARSGDLILPDEAGSIRDGSAPCPSRAPGGGVRPALNAALLSDKVHWAKFRALVTFNERLI
jgi:hypothetical protein